MAEHKLTTQYTTDDDGIHVCCSCGWSVCLGYGPEPERVAQAARAHQAREDWELIDLDAPVDHHALNAAMDALQYNAPDNGYKPGHDAELPF